MSSEFALSPVRSIDDFLLSKARFQKPRFSQRIVSNLIYYQTNYFLITAFNLILFGMLNPQKMLWALMVSAIGSIAIIFSATRLTKISKGGQPNSKYQTYLFLAIILTTAYLMVYNFSSVAILLSSILISLVLILIHASMRTRNLKNKISNTIDKISPKKTPMGILLDTFNVRSEDFLN